MMKMARYTARACKMRRNINVNTHQHVRALTNTHTTETSPPVVIITRRYTTVDHIVTTAANVFTSACPRDKMKYLLLDESSLDSTANNLTTTMMHHIEQVKTMNHPARPSLPLLVDVKDIPSLKDSGMSQPAYMLHNCAHIELNAVDVCCHTLLLPQLLGIENSLPEEFYLDFLSIAKDEARHFGMLSDRMAELGVSYGDLNSHKMLWEGAAKTCHSLIARVAMCQLINEGRGLDSGPRLIHKLKSCGDKKSAQVMEQIVDEEENHVRLGMKWFLYLCEQSKQEPKTTYQNIVASYYGPLPVPFNHSARERATFPRDWYEPLQRKS